MPKNDTIVALATPKGESAIGIVRLSGPLCEELVNLVFKPSKKIEIRKACYGAYCDVGGNVLDQCIYVLYDEKSFTGECMLEINCHGNPFVVQKIIDDLVLRGVRLAEPGEFSRTAFLNNKIDLSQAEAIVDIIKAKSDIALQMAQKQLSGALRQKIHHAGQILLQLLAEIEAYIDFPEEDLPLEDVSGPYHRLVHLMGNLDYLRNAQKYSSIVMHGVKCVIMGAPNAGKSSLLNALIGEERALVSDEPGTTRDFIRESIYVGPYMVQVIDTAGIHLATSELEKMGIAKSLQNIQLADLLLWVFDVTTQLMDLPEEIKQSIDLDKCIIILNKIDLCKEGDLLIESAKDNLRILLGGKEVPIVLFSAKELNGLISLKHSISESIKKHSVDIMGEDGVVVNARHADVLRRVLMELGEAKKLMEERASGEIIAVHLRAALFALGEITGEADNELILDKLFASFCIGK